jgi:hypothetical protein
MPLQTVEEAAELYSRVSAQPNAIFADACRQLCGAWNLTGLRQWSANSSAAGGVQAAVDREYLPCDVARTLAARSCRLVLDGTDDCRQNRAGNAATGHLADDAADIRRRGGVGEQRNQHAEDLSPDAAPDRTRDGVSKRTEIDVLGGACGNIAADGAADDDMTRYSPDPV